MTEENILVRLSSPFPKLWMWGGWMKLGEQVQICRKFSNDTRQTLQCFCVKIDLWCSFNRHFRYSEVYERTTEGRARMKKKKFHRFGEFLCIKMFKEEPKTGWWCWGLNLQGRVEMTGKLHFNMHFQLKPILFCLTRQSSWSSLDVTPNTTQVAWPQGKHCSTREVGDTSNVFRWKMQEDEPTCSCPIKMRSRSDVDRFNFIEKWKENETDV